MSSNAVPTASGATLLATAKTFGLPYPLGFDYGITPSNSTPTQTAGGGDFADVVAEVSGLASSTAYQFRPFATAGTPALRVVGATKAFTTLAGPPGEDPPVTQCVVPKPAKKAKVRAVKQSLFDANCTAGKVTKKKSKKIKKGRLIKLSPKPGSVLDAGAPVKLIVSKG